MWLNRPLISGNRDVIRLQATPMSRGNGTYTEGSPNQGSYMETVLPLATIINCVGGRWTQPQHNDNGNGANGHPGRTVGASGPGGGGPNVSAGAAALLAKMFSEPLRDPVPCSTQFLPCDTEEVHSEREGKGSMYSPVMWADPLLPINMTIGSVSSSIDRLPAVGVSVSNRLDMQEPMLTQQGLLLKSIVDTDAAPTILRSMMPVKGMKDTSALICLLELSRRTGIQAMTDEAPLIRLGLLMHCLAPVEWSSYTTSCIHNMVANGYADVSKATKTWTPAPAQSTQTQIGIESGAKRFNHDSGLDHGQYKEGGYA